MEKKDKLSKIKLAFADLPIDDMLEFMKDTTPHIFNPAETITENGEIIQGIVLTFLKGKRGGDLKLLFFDRKIQILQFPINKTYRISWNRFKFLDYNDNQKNNLLNVFIHKDEYYICVDTTQKVAEGWKEKQTCFVMYNLSYALKDTCDIRYAPVATFTNEYRPLDEKTSLNNKEAKDLMFRYKYLTKMNTFII